MAKEREVYRELRQDWATVGRGGEDEKSLTPMTLWSVSIVFGCIFIYVIQ